MASIEAIRRHADRLLARKNDPDSIASAEHPAIGKPLSAPGERRAVSGSGIARRRGGLNLNVTSKENIIAIEHACIRVVRKPWGSTDLRPWSEIDDDGIAIGELWFQRAAIGALEPALLLKLLFTKEPLSIQVHPNDAFAQSIGLAHGKTEAWYVLAAAPGAAVAVGLKRQLAAAQLRASIEDGSILDLVRWRRVAKDDVIFIPAGTIHAIGAGLVIAEIQQRSDTTFRLFDHGRQRTLHVDNAVAAATAAPAENQLPPRRLADARTLLVVSPQFILERVDLPPGASRQIDAKRETWMLVIEGQARVGLMDVFVGQCIFLESDRTSIKAGPAGLKGLVAYPGPEPLPGLLHDIDQQIAYPRSGLTEVRT